MKMRSKNINSERTHEVYMLEIRNESYIQCCDRNRAQNLENDYEIVLKRNRNKKRNRTKLNERSISNMKALQTLTLFVFFFSVD